MVEKYINHSDIKAFAEQKVNLPKDQAQKHRDQVNRLKDRLAMHISDNPGFALVKMLHAGSVAKGTALKTVNDLDVAVYVKKEEAPISDEELVPWIAERLREANPNITEDQFDVTKPHCITISFRGTGLDVDVVPILYEDDPNGFGYLISKDTGERMLTSIQLHLEFIRTRKNAQPAHFAQLVRLAKWWARQQKVDQSFKCKSFMLELIIAYLSDQGADLSRYDLALENFFSYLVKTELEERISFADYYSPSSLPGSTYTPIEIFDPVNPLNNITQFYTVADSSRLVDAADEAISAITEAHYSTTKSRAIDCWQVVFGPSFRG